LVADVFRDKAIFDSLPGESAVGHNRYSTTGPSSDQNVQPLLVQDRSGPVAMAHNGNLINYIPLRRFLEEEGSLFRTTSDSELILQLAARSHAKEFLDRLMEALRLVKGAYSLVLLTRDQMFAVRDPNGFRPLCIGARDGGWIVASESCAFDLIGAEYIRDVEPGEVIAFDRTGMNAHRFAKPQTLSHCIFEFVYFSRPDSRVFSDNVDKTRRKFGHVLAQKHPAPPGVDFVMAVPDSSNTAALGFAHESGLPFEIALIRNHYVGRTFIEPEQKLRDFGVKLKFNPVLGVLKGKKVVLVDDSIVRGTTIRKLVRHIRQAGALEVHVRISSPPIRFPCFYGMDFPSRDELAANEMTIEQIRAFIEADSLEYLTAEELVQAAPHDNGQEYCTACFTGRYPIQEQHEDGPVKLGC
jgi:amidophosphoribosyltransferase